LLEQERAWFLPLPATEFEACRKSSVASSSLSLIRFDSNDYSVLVRWAHHPVVVKGFYDRVEIHSKEHKIASHVRIWDRAQVSFDPVHYLAILEEKPGAFDQARPLEQWGLPECFSRLRQRLENQMAGEGTREYIRVLRLLEKHPLARLTQAVEQRIRNAKFPIVKTIDSFDFSAQPPINPKLVVELLVGQYIDQKENILLVGNPGTGKTHLCSALGYGACSQGKKVRFFTVSGLVTHMLEMRELRSLERLHKQLEKLDLLTLDELGYVLQ